MVMLRGMKSTWANVLYFPNSPPTLAVMAVQVTWQYLLAADVPSKREYWRNRQDMVYKFSFLRMPETVTYTAHTSTMTRIRVIIERTAMRKSETPTRAFLRYVGQISKTNCNITTDFFLSSCLDVFENLSDHGLTFVGKIKGKERAEFLPHRNKETGISIYGFMRAKMLLSFAP